MESTFLSTLQGAFYMAMVGLSWVTYGYAMGQGAKRNIHVGILLAFNVAMLAIFSGGLGIFTSSLPTMGKAFWLMAAVLFSCGLSNYFQLELMSRAMGNGPNGIIWALIQSAFVFPFIIGIVSFGARATGFTICGICLQLGAMAILGGTKDRTSTGPWRLPTCLAFACTVFQMLGGNLPSYYPECQAVSSCWRSMFSAAGMASMAIIGTVCTSRRQTGKVVYDNLSKKYFWFVLALLLVSEVIANIIFYFPGMDLLAKAGVGGIAMPICVASSIIGMEVFSLVWLREKRNWKQKTALAMLIVGTVALCF